MVADGLQAIASGHKSTSKDFWLHSGQVAAGTKHSVALTTTGSARNSEPSTVAAACSLGALSSRGLHVGTRRAREAWAWPGQGWAQRSAMSCHVGEVSSEMC